MPKPQATFIDNVNKYVESVLVSTVEEYNQQEDTEDINIDLFLDTFRKRHLVGGGKRKKDPNAPNGRRTAYVFFCTDIRSKVQKDNPDLGFGGISKKLGEMWRGLNDKKKAKYVKQAEDDALRYEKEMDEYNSS